MKDEILNVIVNLICFMVSAMIAITVLACVAGMHVFFNIVNFIKAVFRI